MKSMTGYGNAQASSETGSVTIELRSVNSRYLDLQFRMPDELRMAEMPLRELVAKTIVRGKVEIRASYSRSSKDMPNALSPTLLKQVRDTYAHIKEQLPFVQPPSFGEVMQWTGADKSAPDPMLWVPLCLEAGEHALAQLQQTREREGARLIEVIAVQAHEARAMVDTLKGDLPELLQSQSNRIAARIRQGFEQACPEGIAHISAQEISERLAAEASLFSLRADVAEELDRLGLHLTELEQTLGVKHRQPNADSAPSKGIGKRLDFLFQEMNREANTLGSKAVDMRLTRAAISLKLLIEQMREQIQNIE